MSAVMLVPLLAAVVVGCVVTGVVWFLDGEDAAPWLGVAAGLLSWFVVFLLVSPR